MHMKQYTLYLIQHPIHQWTMTWEVLHVRPKLTHEVVTYLNQLASLPLFLSDSTKAYENKQG